MFERHLGERHRMGPPHPIPLPVGVRATASLLLHGLTLRERGEALISIAHPDVRGELRRALVELRHYVMSPP